MEPGAFGGTERYSVERWLGSGAFGDVYAALDRERGERVALKTLRRVEPASLALFKNEFRSLADILHRNVVMLHELVSDGTLWFLTMELIDGVSVQQIFGSDGSVATTAPAPASLEQVLGESSAASTERLQRRAPDPALLAHLLLQLAEGISALHRAGKLHRDIKPSNVLVDRTGRVVVVDFGLVTEIECRPEGLAAGTAGYMAPEASLGLPLTTASDWYSFGALLYEALTGRMPFDGTVSEILYAQHHESVTPPRRLATGIPPVLEDLCLRLLDRDPLLRPPVDEILECLASVGHAKRSRFSPSVPFSSAAPASTPFVGRESEASSLRRALDRAIEGHPVVVHVHGASGAGKTTLVQRFVDELVEKERAFVLQGRCYERESVPFKALDGLMDSLARQLRDGQCGGSTVADSISPLLLRTFPTLGGVARAAPAPTDLPPDPAELRRKLASSVRELLGRLAAARPLVLVIDDVQWGDTESATLLGDFVRDAGTVLLLVCSRDAAAAPGAFVSVLVGESPAADVRRVGLAPLRLDESLALARTLLASAGSSGGDHAEVVARESGGNPFLVHEIARHVVSDRAFVSEGFSLEALWRSRVDILPEPARELLRTLALAAGPIDAALAYRAAGCEGSPTLAVRQLGSSSLLRNVGPGEIVVWHDRVRDAVVSMLSPEDVSRRHFALGATLEAAGGTEPETIATHFQAAGDTERAGRYFADAAARAASALAFERAAKLFRLAMQLRPGDGKAALALRVDLADALADAGRGPEAATEYLAACEGAPARTRLSLQQRAAAALLRSGHIEQGLPVLRDVMTAVGVRMPTTPRRALASLVVRRARLRWRGLDFRERETAEISEDEVLRIDACWSVATALGVVDVVQSADVQTRHLLLALDAGEPFRIARGLAGEGASCAGEGTRKTARTEELLAMARAAAARSRRAEATGIVLSMESLAYWCLGRWRLAYERGEEALASLRERCSGVSWEHAQTTIIRLDALTYLGEWGRIRQEVPEVIEDARERGDLYLEVVTSLRAACVRARADDDLQAARDALRSIARWRRARFDSVRLVHLHETMEMAVYTGRPEDALAAWDANERLLRGSHLQRVQIFRVHEWILLAAANLHVAAQRRGITREWYLRAAGRWIERLEREGAGWGMAVARLYTASASAMRGRTDRAEKLVRRAERDFDALDMHLYANVARAFRGNLVGGDEGRALRDAARKWFDMQKIRNPARVASAMAPLLG